MWTDIQHSPSKCVYYFAVSTSPQYPVAGPFTHLIYKNISIPVYSTLKGVRRQPCMTFIPFFYFATVVTANAEDVYW